MAALILWVLELMENEIIKTLTDLAAGRKFAVGNDLVFVPDFTASLSDLFIHKAYTDQEVAYCSSFDDAALRYASTWAAKEAVYKALKQLDPRITGLKKIEITREKTAGKPDVVLHTGTKPYQISLTITHDGDYAWAIAFIELI